MAAGPARSKLTLLAAGLGAAVALGAVLLEVTPWAPLAGGVLSVVLREAAALGVLAGIRLYRPLDPLPWYLLAAAAALLGVGRAILEVQAHAFGRAPGPGSWADIPFLLGIVLLVTALLIMIERRSPGARAMSDVVTIAVAVGLGSWVFFVHPIVHDGELAGLSRAAQIGYQAFDVALLAALLRLLAGGRWSPPFVLVAAGATAYLGGDLGWNWVAAAHIDPGGWPNAGCTLSAPLIAAAALHPSMASVAIPTGRTLPARLQLRAVSLLVGPVVLGLAHLRHSGSVADREIDVLVLVVGLTLAWALVLRDLVGLVRRGESLSSQLAAQNERLRELDRLKDEFVATVSHELRSPLTAIRGYLHLLRGERAGPLTAQQREFLEIIEASSERLTREIGDLLSVARMAAHGVEPRNGETELAELAARCVTALEPLAEQKSIALRLDRNGALPITGDPELLLRVVDNLVSNAIKFTPPDGSVEVRLARRGRLAVLEVEDSGIGIPKSEQHLLFERFFRSSSAIERAIPGTGIGLYVVKRIVDAHGGFVAVESGAGAGTTFRVELPLVS